MTDIGELKHRLVLEAPIEPPDGAGGSVRGYAAVATLWAAVTPIAQAWSAGRADLSADALGTTVTHRIVIRAGPELSVRHRLRAGSRLYQIVAWREAERRFLEIEAEERRD